MIPKEQTEALSLATLIVGSVMPRVQQEIEALGGSVSQIGTNPNLFRVQIPIPHRRWNDQTQQRPAQDDIEIGEEGGQGYLLLRWNGWMCDYYQHPYDIAQTSLRSLDDPLEGEEVHDTREVGHVSRCRIAQKRPTPSSPYSTLPPLYSCVAPLLHPHGS
jgi:hypothetical protein